MLEDADSLPRRPGNVPADLWHWIVAEVGIDVAQHVDPQVAVVLAARLATRRGPPGTESAEALRLWPWFIDSSRRLAQQQEMMFIECALAQAGPTIRYALLNRLPLRLASTPGLRPACVHVSSSRRRRYSSSSISPRA